MTTTAGDLEIFHTGIASIGDQPDSPRFAQAGQAGQAGPLNREFWTKDLVRLDELVSFRELKNFTVPRAICRGLQS